MVATSSLLGTNHLEITVGSTGVPFLPPEAEIKTRNTVDMNEVIAKLGSLGDRLEQVVTDIGKNLGGGESGNLFKRIDQLVTDNGPKLTETISNLQDITAKIRSGEGTIGKLVNDSKLHDDLLASVKEIKGAATDARAFVSNAQSVIDQMKSRQGRARHAGLRRADRQRDQDHPEEHPGSLRQTEQRPGNPWQVDQRRLTAARCAGHHAQS